jgi:pimeloyl-ACP methyl ester carboxylesterase
VAVVIEAAWETTPSSYILTKQDRMLPPEFLRTTAERMKANTTELDASHVPQAWQPEAIAAVTTNAATTGGAG